MTTLYVVKLRRNGSPMAHLHLHRITLSDHSCSYTSLIFLIASNLPCFFPCILLSVCMFDQNQMDPSFISPLEMFHGICNIERLKGREGGSFGAVNYLEDLNWRGARLNIYIYIYIHIYIYERIKRILKYY